MNSSYLSTKASVRLADGVRVTVADDVIEAGETVAAFGGSCCTRAQLNLLDESRRRRSTQIDEDLFMVATPEEEPGDQINHSCAPNCGVAAGVLIVAMRRIEPGEELTFDYAMSDGCDYDEFDCTCGAPHCRGRISGNDWMIPELQLAYRSWFSPYLAKRISALISLGAERRAFAL